ncbi:arsenate reductase family protein [Muriicola soli]|uniref:Arsenate reductase n=1 Tax=Muriicola soli TaxID=2507538 RepID=A0A411EA71_9FLAO|nr:hypothetical protein [Muriicola soli]QBA64611.1 hypothetical protein EQY75_08775 [Muriicola soli]
MGEIASSDRQITLFYSSESSKGKQTLAYAKAEGIAIREIDILKSKLTGTQISELAARLKLEIKDLVNQDHPSYAKKFEQHDFSDNDWIKMIRNHPEILRQPIALRGDNTVMVETPTDIIKI